MKVLGVTVLLLLCTAVLHALKFSPRGHQPPTCCLNYTTRQIPREYVVAYLQTSGTCSKPGVLFLNRQCKKICADPRETWVQKYIKSMEGIPQGDKWSHCFGRQ